MDGRGLSILILFPIDHTVSVKSYVSPFILEQYLVISMAEGRASLLACNERHE